MAISESLHWRISDAFSDVHTGIKGSRGFLSKERTLLTFATEKHPALLDLLRQLTVSLSNEASKQSGLTEAEILYHQTQEVLEQLYADPLIWARAQDIHEYPVGSEYHMVAEMSRDIAKYYQKIAALTGNVFFNQKAVTWFSAAAQLADATSSVAHLAQLERTHHMVTRGARELEPNEQLSTFDGYMTIVEAAEHAGGFDRAAAASWLMMEIAQKTGNILLYRSSLSELIKALEAQEKSTAQYLIQRVGARVVAKMQQLQYRLRSSSGSEFMLPQLEKSRKVKRA